MAIVVDEPINSPLAERIAHYRSGLESVLAVHPASD